jgi:hypothetical protein
MARRPANKAEAEEAAHTLSHQPWMPRCEWRIIERTDGSAYVRGYMALSIPDGEDRRQLDRLTHYLGGRFRVGSVGHPRSWHGRYGKAEVCISMPDRPASSQVAPAPQARRPTPPPMQPCPAKAETQRLRDALDRVRTMADLLGRTDQDHDPEIVRKLILAAISGEAPH